ncbi:TVP38/TMEM64 family protein [Roseicella aerolata]|uniref:TVP38/TMEM64 family membrane protein n=1 Tax=Roseicella aerolata TaxID=2883479 RepID=A0A9X1LCA3_9PROT|nr:VTT domain-containing protein [Roseicella aerolata]MCB4823943.1 VTT domain-containing protein [Roseicella aerolata]
MAARPRQGSADAEGSGLQAHGHPGKAARAPSRVAGRPGLRRFWPLALLLAAILLIFALGLHRQLSLAALAEYRRALAELVAARPVAAALLYVGTYAGAIALAVPAGPVLTMAGGLLFGLWLGTALAAAAATTGACLLFLAVRSALAPVVARHAGRLVETLRPGLERDGGWYLLSLRLLPIVPYWLGTIAPALVGMRLLPFATGTALGILPGTAVFASLGAGLDDIFAHGETPDLSAVLSPSVLLPLTGLAVLSLLTTWWRRRRREG